MKTQKYFNYKFSKNNNFNDFYVNETNKKAYELSNNDKFDQNIFLFGPRKSGKSILLNNWKIKNNAIFYNDNFTQIIKSYNNVAIDDCFSLISEENLFHLINHCRSYNLKIFCTSSVDLNSYIFNSLDLHSRLREFYYLEIDIPDDEMCLMLLTKLFTEKQIIIKNKEIFEYIFKRVERSYLSICNLVEKIDHLSLEKKRQLTIPLIKEIM